MEWLQNDYIWLGGVVVVFAILFLWDRVKLSRNITWEFLEDIEDNIQDWATEQGKNGVKREQAIANLVDNIYVVLPLKVRFIAKVLDIVSKIIPVETIKVSIVKGLDALYGEILDRLDDGVSNDSIE